MKNRLFRLLLVALLLATTSRAAGTNSEANIARVIAEMLERSHFAAHRHDGDLSEKFLDHYLDILDGTHMHFTEADIAEFAHYRTSLEEITLKSGDVRPAHEIFARYVERLGQRVNFVKAALTNEVFDFTGHDTYRLDRAKAPRPADLAAAQQLWRQHLRYEYLQELLGKKKPAEIVQQLTRRYDRQLRLMQQFKPDQVLELYLNALAHVYDPHSDYLGPRQLEEFSMRMRNSLFGIGAILQFDDGYCKICEVLPGGPAATSNLIKPGDRIVAVAQGEKEPVDIVEMPLNEAVQLIRGPKGTTVVLTIIPADADMSVRKTISLVRDEIKLESQQAKATIVDGPGADGKKVRLGVIDLPSFYASEGVSATADVSLLLAKLAEANVQGIILDLRRNGGGSLDEAIKLTGLFFDYGPVVQTKDSEGRVQTSRDPDSLTRCDKPLIVLTSRMSASASELLAGAIQDYGRGIIVGDPSTFGKGTVQNMIQLASVMKELNLPTDGNPGALKLTIRKFYRPSGSSTQLKGVVPDIILPTPTSPMKLGEIEMSEALPWDQVPVARFDKQQRVEPYVAMLRRKSARRIAGDEEFVWLREDIERFRKRRDDPVVSLNEAERRREQKEQEHRLEERNRERARNKPAPETKYEITLKNVSAPGLPAPVSASSTNATLASTKTNHDALGDDDKPSVGDPVLDETKHILADYIDALTSH